MAFVCKQTAVLVVRINNNGVLSDLYVHFSLYTLPHTSDGLTSCISLVFFSLKNLDQYDHCAACCVALSACAKCTEICTARKCLRLQ